MRTLSGLAARRDPIHHSRLSVAGAGGTTLPLGMRRGHWLQLRVAWSWRPSQSSRRESLAFSSHGLRDTPGTAFRSPRHLSHPLRGARRCPCRYPDSRKPNLFPYLCRQAHHLCELRCNPLDSPSANESHKASGFRCLKRSPRLSLMALVI